MANKFTPEQIQERFEALPADLKEIISSSDVAEGIENVGRRNGLRIDKIGLLIEETGLVMLGFVKTNEFVNNLASKLEVNKETAEAMAVEIDTEVFHRMRDSLRQVQYQSTTDKRFEEGSDYGDSPARDSMMSDIEKHADSAGVDAALSSTDYDPAGFNQASEIDIPAARAPAGQAAPSSNSDPYKLEQDVVAPVAGANTAGKDPEVAVDFKKKLQQKIDSQKTVLNKDPYRELIE